MDEVGVVVGAASNCKLAKRASVLFAMQAHLVNPKKTYSDVYASLKRANRSGTAKSRAKLRKRMRVWALQVEHAKRAFKEQHLGATFMASAL